MQPDATLLARYNLQSLSRNLHYLPSLQTMPRTVQEADLDQVSKPLPRRLLCHQLQEVGPSNMKTFN
jgi:hypothetical protein